MVQSPLNTHAVVSRVTIKVYSLAWDFIIYIHALCIWAAKALVSMRICAFIYEVTYTSTKGQKIKVHRYSCNWS